MFKNEIEIDEYSLNSEDIDEINEEEKCDIIDKSTTKYRWDEAKVKLLLKFYLKNLDKFRNFSFKKRDLWQSIGDVIGENAESCDKKFRSLKHHYVHILTTQTMLPRKPVSWPFFDIFEQINEDRAFKLHDNLEASIMLVESKPAVFVEEAENTICEEPKPRKKRYEKINQINKDIKEKHKNAKNKERKIDKLVKAIEVSNSIQRERNKLFQQILELLSA